MPEGQEGSTRPPEKSMTRAERSTSTWTMRLRDAAERALGGGNGGPRRPETPAAAPEPVRAPEPEPQGWLFNREEDLAGVSEDPNVIVAIRRAERAHTNPSRKLASDSLSKSFQDIEQAVDAGNINPTRTGEIQDILIKIAGRVEELDQNGNQAAEARNGDSEALRQVAEAVKTMTERTAVPAPKVEGFKFVKVENPNDPESQVVGIMTSLNELEERATKESKVFEDRDFEAWAQEIRQAISAIPNDVSRKPEFFDRKLSRLTSPPREVYLKEKLSLLFEARRRLHNRKIEVADAKGSLGKMIPAQESSGSLGKSITVSFTEINPVDWYVLIHHDDILKDAAPNADREIKVPVADALTLWTQVGESWGKQVEVSPGEKLPHYNKRTLIDESAMFRLRADIAKRVGLQAEQAAFDILTVSLSFNKWDKNRDRLSNDDPRDIMHFEEKRRQDFYEKDRPAGPEDTIGRYFAKAHQGEAPPESDPDNPDYDKTILDKLTDGDTPVKLSQEKRKTVRKNAQKAVFKYSLNEPARGQLIGDLFETMRVANPDHDEEAKEGPNSRKRISLLEYSKTHGWKAIPFETLQPEFYSGYYGYLFGFIAQTIQKELATPVYDPNKDGVLTPSFWIAKHSLLNRINLTSPYFAELNEKEYAQKIQEFKRTYALGVIWGYSDKVLAPRGFVESIFAPRRGMLTYAQIRDIYRGIEASGFLNKSELVKLKSEVGGILPGQGYRFMSSSTPPQRR